ncbi:MAG: Extradiol ring-cleavage dioxygenase class III protein subunit B, partial [uncultured bacterium]
MLSFVAITPHPPIIIPEVGGKDTKKCSKTIKAMEKLADELAEVEPDTIIIVSPHALAHSDRFAIYGNNKFEGSLKQFGAPEVDFRFNNDRPLVNEIIKRSEDQGVKSFLFGDPDNDFFELDHGEMVPLYFFKQKISSNTKIVVIAYSYLDRLQHLALGQIIRDIAKSPEFINDKIALIASGDLSHRLIGSVPAGFSKAGAEFDETIVDYLQNKHIREILEMDEGFVESAGECGYRSILILLGAL